MDEVEQPGTTRGWQVSGRRHRLGVELGERPGADVLTLSGDLDAQTHDQLRELFRDADVGSQPVLVLDLGAVEFVDSSGLGALAVARTATTARGARLVLVASTRAVTRLLSITRFDQSIPTYATLDEALAALG